MRPLLPAYLLVVLAACTTSQRIERGIELVVCDLAGTTVDYGSVTPAICFREVFRRHSLEVTDAELTGPMGKRKDDHIREVLAIPRITAQWRARHGGAVPGEADVQAMLREFVQLDHELLPTTSLPVPGVPEALRALHADGVKIAYTSGYPRELMDICLANLRAAGAPVDASCAADEVPSGRPAPHMLLRCLIELDGRDVSRCIAIGDTEADIRAGRSAGFVTVGVVQSGMLVGLTLEEQRRLPPEELQQRYAAARARLHTYGADHVIDDASRLPQLIASLRQR
jgi:phosphonoacetaldehyde hydrolase